MNQGSAIVSAVVLAVGIAAGGYLAGDGFLKAKLGDRYVTVKGVSEKDVTADLTVWQIPISASSSSVTTAQAKIDGDLGRIRAFLAKYDITDAEIAIGGPQVQDLLARGYSGDRSPNDPRFVVTQALLVQTTKIASVIRASQAVGDLVKEGVVVEWSTGPAYIFTKLNDVKPAMIAEATREARKAAQQFASDSDSKVGAIRQASQGVFSIIARTAGENTPESSQPEKTVRVVSTVQFYLAD
jgi:hypothetical protein